MQNLFSLWYIPVFSIILILIFPFGIYYMAHVGKNKKWMKTFFMVFWAYVICLFVLVGNLSAEFGAVGFMICWGYTLVFMIAHSGEFVARKYNRDLHQFTPPKKERPVNPPRQETKPNEVVCLGSQLINNLNKWKREIESVSMQQDITELVNLSTIVMQRNDEERIQFFNRYSEKLNSMLSKYDEIENTRINSPEMIKSMELIEKTISEIVGAFKNEINSMYKKDLLDLHADNEAFMKDLRYKGLID